MSAARGAQSFGIPDAVEAIRAYNQNESLQAADFLLHTSFSSPSAALDPSTMVMRIVLLDGLWATQLFREQGAAQGISRSLAATAASMLDAIYGLAPDELEVNPGRVHEAASQLLPTILHHSNDGKRHRLNYSFASKFLHWTSPRHFPIMDSKARKTINRLQRARGEKNRVPAMATGSCVDDYGRWLWFYSDAIRSLSDQDRSALIEADQASLLPAYRVENTLLRILDKGFYTRGGGTALGWRMSK